MKQDKFQKLYANKQIKVIKLIEFLKERPRTLQGIANFLEINKNSVKNYINTLKDLEVDLKQGELRKYYI
jgi:DNA-binding IclR family transcriptional regulator